ncbi:glycosyltransferase family 2 protein [Patescibacteria group bacterium]|nr:glycosyltransferase family 2 protein [Patescibacteria group bacterium]
MKLSIIILNHSTAKLVKNLITSIIAMEFPWPYELIVIDNGEQGVLAKEIKAYISHIKFHEIDNNGYAHGNNYGIRKAKGEYIMILNPDIYIKQDAIVKLVEYIESNDKIGMVGPKLLNADGSYQNSCTRYPDWHLPFFRRTPLGKTKAGKKWLSKYLYLDYDHNSPKQVDALFGAAWVIRRKAIDEVGLLDERYFLYFEDLDWCRQFNEKNWQVWYLPSSEVIHFHHRDSADKKGIAGAFTRLGRVHLVSWFRYLLKWK